MLGELRLQVTRDHSDSGEGMHSSEEEGAASQAVNLQILTAEEDERTTQRGRSKVADTKKDSRTKPRTDHKLSSVMNSSYEHKTEKQSEGSDSSDQESDIPLLSSIRSSKTIQKHVDRAVAKLETRQAEQNDQV